MSGSCRQQPRGHESEVPLPARQQKARRRSPACCCLRFSLCAHISISVLQAVAYFISESSGKCWTQKRR